MKKKLIIIDGPGMHAGGGPGLCYRARSVVRLQLCCAPGHRCLGDNCRHLVAVGRLHSLTIRAQDSKGAWGRFAGEVSSMSFYNSRGDVNMDSIVSISDVTALIDYLLSFDESIVDLEAADTSADVSVSISEVSTLIDYLLSDAW